MALCWGSQKLSEGFEGLRRAAIHTMETFTAKKPAELGRKVVCILYSIAMEVLEASEQ